MLGWLRRKWGLSEAEKERLENEWYQAKSSFLEKLLGNEHDRVMHAIIPFNVGGALDLYYYPNGISGTGIATKELARACGKSSTNAKYKKYEFVMFTKAGLDIDHELNEDTYFGKMHKRVNTILNLIARYSAQARLNPGETCEIPQDADTVGGACLIFDSYEPEGAENGDGSFGLMLIMEIHRDEMEFAMKQGGVQLLTLLKENGAYPYSDLDRPSVIGLSA